ncbi:amino acid ABC transporter substrate-binding protein [Bordetella genomosp. 13]|uniref:amino acid ABC transporter substrate-binding protein n=1 Tax=Bordetella genomosp. 13 TaxID=463040 RepID=UPI0011A78438|nr:amino acid ABC transporter substrate-binding protein [Bordetella genomosp. 13]
MMHRYLTAAIAMACLSASAQAADTLAKIKSSNTVTMGVRESTAFSYALGTGKYTGFHYDVCTNIIEDLKKTLGVPGLQTRYQVVTSQNRIPLVSNGTVDLECGATTNNAPRQKEVGFAMTTYVEEVRMAVRAGSGIESVKDLNGKTVVTTTGTTSVQLLRRKSRDADFKEVFGKDHAESFLLLEQGRADAFVIDASTLAALISKSRDPASLRIVGEPLSVEPIAIMIPKDDPAFKKAVDDSIRAQIASGTLLALWDKWFLKPIPPNQVTVNLPLSQATRDAWANPNDKPTEQYAQP